ncbi:quaternary ammonium compound-resistance protein SugE [Actinopolyspora xinjiangensis]|uniref:Quaternary ammonium compound-resistance protein SugE n=1 Tax=Actinopolyspora xinjiangensis TaxID=405564 RepID=A0A1H0V6N4_9ACTN|nr:multidrug efflux SMR transporter [Actinopolyspora xinjiangensis]SDP73838.1 quaternary ammonium compound-resistance protein SugE [Actinopolyspora xinjiangensis]
MAWIYLAIATIFEIAFALCSSASQGFTRLGYSILTLVIGAAGTFFLSMALISIDVGVGYAIWTGLGSVGIVLLGTVLFKERLDWRKSVGIAAVVVGVVGLNLSGAA